MEFEWLVLGGLALVVVSLYRQGHGAGDEPGGQEPHPGQGLLSRLGEPAEESKSQPEKSSKNQIKSPKTTRLAQRPQKDRKSGQPQKGNSDEAVHAPSPQSRASTARGSNKHLCCNDSQRFFPGLGGVVDVLSSRGSGAHPPKPWAGIVMASTLKGQSWANTMPPQSSTWATNRSMGAWWTRS